MKKILLAFLLISAFLSKAQMVLEYDIITPNTQIAIPLAGTVNVTVDWGDGTIQSFATSGGKKHTYTTTGTKTVTISGSLTDYGLSSYSSGNARLTKVLKWDGLGLQSLSYAFVYAYVLQQVPDTLPSTVTNIKAMFSRASNFNQSLNNWNTENVTDMSSMFYGASSFNGNIGDWNTQNVTDMSGMFYEAKSFNQEIGNWNTMNVVSLYSMFYKASLFNQPVGDWNTENVTSMSNMFYEAKSFNQPIGKWNTQNVTKMNSMFYSAHSFNQDISKWNTQNVTNMGLMFIDARSFNQPVGEWNIRNVTNLRQMFASADSFDQELSNWDTRNVTSMYGMFSFARTFNHPIGNWNVEKVSDMRYMFMGATSFNQALNSWNTQNVTSMSSMFYNATSFNQELKDWQVHNVTDMEYMFYNAVSFSQNLGNWNIEKIESLSGFFGGVKLCTETYDSILISWSKQNLRPQVYFNGGLSNYSSDASAARATIVQDDIYIDGGGRVWNIGKNWSINDGGLDSLGLSYCNKPCKISFEVIDEQNGFVLDTIGEFFDYSFNHKLSVKPNIVTDKFYFKIHDHYRSFVSQNSEFNLDFLNSDMGFSVELFYGNPDSTKCKIKRDFNFQKSFYFYPSIYRENNTLYANTNSCFYPTIYSSMKEFCLSGYNWYKSNEYVSSEVSYQLTGTDSDVGTYTFFYYYPFYSDLYRPKETVYIIEPITSIESPQSQPNKTLLKTYNLQGQEITEETKGIQIRVYSDGSREKVFLQ